MTQWPLTFGTPLVGKELAELSAKRGTHALRTAYAAVLFLSFAVLFYSTISGSGPAVLDILGRGKPLFEFLVHFQFVAIFLFLPATMAETMAYEKERGSLGLLFLTGVRPWEILLGKFVARLVPTFTFLSLSLPLFAIAYAFGGVSYTEFVLGLYYLAIACLQVGALTLFCSTFFSTAARALLGAYAAMALAFFLLPLLTDLLKRAGLTIPLSTEEFLDRLFPLSLFMSLQGGSIADGFEESLTVVSSTVLFLVGCRFFLLRRANVSRTVPVKGWFAFLDSRLRGLKILGRSLLRGRRTAPKTDRPVAWREAHKLGLGEIGHIARFVLVLEIAVCVLAYILPITGTRTPGDIAAFSGTVFVLWTLTLAVTVVLGTDAIIGERSRQTLDILLSTPLSSEEIVCQKSRGVYRLLAVSAAPFLTLFLLEAWAEAVVGGTSVERLLLYMGASCLSVAVFLPTAAWISIWAGLKFRRRVFALAAALLCLANFFFMPTAVWIVLAGILLLNALIEPDFGVILRVAALFFVPGSFILLSVLAVTGLPRVNVNHPLYYARFSPAEVIHKTEYLCSWGGDLGVLLITFILYFLVNVGVLWFVRSRCLRKADDYLERL